MRNESHGLKMIAASLAVIVVVIGLIAQREVDLRREQVRIQGIGLTSAMSRIPFERLVPSDHRLDLLQLLKSTQTSPDFAYAVIVDLSGRVLAKASVPDLPIPDADRTDEPSSWLEEHTIQDAARKATLREFSSPILVDGELMGHVRIAFLEPGYAVVLDAPSFHGAVALLVFLLMPISYLLLRREIQPLSSASTQLHQILADAGSLPLPDSSSGAVDDFMQRFETFIEFIEQRSVSLRKERTELLASTKVLSHQKSRFEALLEALPDAAIALDHSGVVNFANGKLGSLLGLGRDEILGQAPEEWCPTPEAETFIRPYCGAAGRRLRADRLEFALDGLGEKRIAMSAHPLSEDSGTLVVFRDVTAETVARKTQAEFLAHMAHELKAPLNVLALSAESLTGSEGGQEEFRIEACNVIQDEIERLTKLIDTLFSIARIESGNMEIDRQRIRLSEFLADALEAVSRGGEGGIRFSLEVPKQLSVVHADKQLLRIALDNLLTNAVKYSREGGSITLCAEEDDRELVVRVLDTGIGIPEEDISRIFEKFYRSENEGARKRPGHGLGLALVHEIVGLHGGEIQVQSTLGEGSEFSLVFRKSASLFQEPR